MPPLEEEDMATSVDYTQVYECIVTRIRLRTGVCEPPIYMDKNIGGRTNTDIMSYVPYAQQRLIC